jgi:hypothetical protein
MGRSSVDRIATGYGVEVGGSNEGGGEISRTRPDWPWGPPTVLYDGYRVIQGVKSAAAWRWQPSHM